MCSICLHLLFVSCDSFKSIELYAYGAIAQFHLLQLRLPLHTNGTATTKSLMYLDLGCTQCALTLAPCNALSMHSHAPRLLILIAMTLIERSPSLIDIQYGLLYIIKLAAQSDPWDHLKMLGNRAILLIRTHCVPYLIMLAPPFWFVRLDFILYFCLVGCIN